ncbi:MAG TPA: tetratricopeptide repeat protein [Spirochaetia bacterium]|nr:tetratricopeptide repeat protein [Spirochaetales bacterium]HRY72249.1 tetratricopeptide repeat protein [Spirochaetia bacterium]
MDPRQAVGTERGRPRGAAGRRRAGGAVRVLLALAALGLLSSCGPDGDLKRLLDLEDRSAVGAPPQSVEELKEGIAKYSKEAERVVLADEKVGIYYKILASRLLEKKLYGEAYEALAKAVEYFPSNSNLYYNAGIAAGYIAKSKLALGPDGEPERRKWLLTSESSYRAAIDINPRYGAALYGLAVLYEFELGRPADSVPLLLRLLEIETRNADAMLLLGRVYYRLGRLEEAVNVYETAARVTRVEAKKKAAEENRERILGEMNAE